MYNFRGTKFLGIFIIEDWEEVSKGTLKVWISLVETNACKKKYHKNIRAQGSKKFRKNDF